MERTEGREEKGTRLRALPTRHRHPRDRSHEDQGERKDRRYRDPVQDQDNKKGDGRKDGGRLADERESVSVGR